MLQEIVGDVLETVLFKRLVADEFGEGVEIPHVVWRPIWDATVEDKAKFVSDLVQNGIVTVAEARMQLGYPAEPDGEVLPQILPKPKSEGEKIVQKTVKGVMEQLNEKQQRGD